MRIIVGLLLLPTLAAAEPAPDFSITTATRGSALIVTFHNQTHHAIHIPTHMFADVLQYDWLSVTVTTRGTHGTSRALSFVTARDKSYPVFADIAIGKSVTETIDLVPWALRGGEPLAPGSYELAVTWDTSTSSHAKLIAAAQLVIAAPIDHQHDAACTTKATAGLELLARQVGKTAVIEVGLHNVSTTELCVLDRIVANETQSDWLALDLGGLEHGLIHFDDARKKAGPVTVTLPPGATSWQRWDLAAWAARKRNAIALPHKAVWATAVYDSSSSASSFAGRVTTSFSIALP
ncbi:MAG: hypothetical protein ABI591_04495 [Kofleriaceae bacterium]